MKKYIKLLVYLVLISILLISFLVVLGKKTLDSKKDNSQIINSNKYKIVMNPPKITEVESQKNLNNDKKENKVVNKDFLEKYYRAEIEKKEFDKDNYLKALDNNLSSSSNNKSFSRIKYLYQIIDHVNSLEISSKERIALLLEIKKRLASIPVQCVTVINNCLIKNPEMIQSYIHMNSNEEVSCVSYYGLCEGNKIEEELSDEEFKNYSENIEEFDRKIWASIESEENEKNN